MPLSALGLCLLALGACDEPGPSGPLPTPPPSDFVTVSGWNADSWGLAVLPDTQYYSRDFPDLFEAQTSWLSEATPSLDLRFAVQLGDLTDNNVPLQWERAAAAMSLLTDALPYALVPGNHDYGPNGTATTRDTLLGEYFPFEEAAAMATFGGAYAPGELDNTYHLFSAGGRDWIVLALEWGPRDEVIAWANTVMEEHADRDGILITHAYLNNNDLRYDVNDTAHPQKYNPHEYGTEGGVNDGEELWQKLVRHHRFAMTLNGHVLGDGTGYLVSETDLGNRCHQMLSNYQIRPLGGEGYLRVLEFLADDATVRVHSYSPYLDSLLDAPDQRFSFTLD